MHKFTALICISCAVMLTACNDEKSKPTSDSTRAQAVATTPTPPTTPVLTQNKGNYSAEMAEMAATLERKGITGKEAEYIMAGYAAALEPPEPIVRPTFDAPPTQAELDEASSLDNSFFDSHLMEPPYRPAENSDLAISSPQSLFARTKDACVRQSQTELFATFSYGFRRAFSRMPKSDRNRSFNIYCKEFDDPKLKDYFQGQRFFIKKSRSTRNDVHKSILCSVPSDSPDSDCDGGMDVSVENGVLKRDEF